MAKHEIIATRADAVTLYKDKYRIEPARLRDWDYRARGWYFVTICTRTRAPIFGEVAGSEVRLTRIGRIADLELQTLNTHYANVNVDEYVVMPKSHSRHCCDRR